MELKWEDGFTVSTRVEGGAIVLRANREGLLSLANHMREMAEHPGRDHIHLDQYNSLEDGSAELIIEKI